MKILEWIVRNEQQFEEISNLFKSNVLPNKEKICKIYKNIYLASGSWVFNNTSEVNININFFQKILNLAPREVEIGTLLTADVYSIDLLDVYSENVYKYFEILNDFFISNRKENILVVCAAGISRSSAIVLAYLLKQKFTLRNAINFLLNKRTQIRPNNGFLLQLMVYEHSLQINQLEPLDFNSFDHLFSILPEYESFVEKERKLNNTAVKIRKNDEWERLYYLGFRKK